MRMGAAVRQDTSRFQDAVSASLTAFDIALCGASVRNAQAECVRWCEAEVLRNSCESVERA